MSRGGSTPHSFTDEKGRVCLGPCGQYKLWSSFNKSGPRDSTKGPAGRHNSWCRECNPQRHSKWTRRSYLKTKRKVIDAYGGKCACCGESELAFLTIDHVNNDGAAHRRELRSKGGTKMLHWLISHGYPDGFQILCSNCNLAKHTQGVCPHQNKAA